MLQNYIMLQCTLIFRLKRQRKIAKNPRKNRAHHMSELEFYVNFPLATRPKNYEKLVQKQCALCSNWNFSLIFHLNATKNCENPAQKQFSL